ncbi:MAG: CBS domain-containing protein [Chloroflexi bacterium]|nr:CBS domain-containing protein [Chloroflexota bacterium]
MPRIFNVATVGGVAIQARMSAAIAFTLLVFFLALVYLPAALHNEQPITLWSVAFISTLALYLSTIAHELGHCFVARHRGIPAQIITMRLFGGTADIPQEPQRPLDVVFISIAGPLCSGLVAGLALALQTFLPNPSPPLALFLEAIFLLNAWLAAYNLLPVLPLDGGRALQGIIWQIRGDFVSATNLAVNLGRLLAGTMATACLVLLVLSADRESTLVPRWIPTDPRIPLVGLMLAYLLNNGAKSVQRSTLLQDRLAGATVSRVMSVRPKSVQLWTTLDEIASQHLRQGRDRAVAVVRDDDILLGLVAFSDVAKVPAKERAHRTAGDVMTPATVLVTVSPQEPLEEAVRHMANRHLNQLPVVEDGHLVGMIDRFSVLQLAESPPRKPVG